MNHESVSLFNVNLAFKRRQTSFIYSERGGREKSEDEEKISEQKNKTIKKNSWLTCKICGVKKNGQKQMDEHMLSVHSEINKKEKNSTPIKQSDTKNNAKGIENISPIKKKPSEVKSNYLLYN